ncbi:MAG: DNA polymerase III subunit delta' [Sporichthyaceae bacterium]
MTAPATASSLPSLSSAPAVWTDVVGQDLVVEVLTRAVRAATTGVQGSAEGMTHAWLFTGPPGSGRSTAARAFAAALQCDQGGCGVCSSCHTVLGGTHADVEIVNTRQLSIGVDDTRALVARAARHPSGGRWQIMLIEDADRLTERAGNALLKAIEEPTPRTIWLLCAPALEDVLPTVRSRCRLLSLRTPSTAAVTDVLVRRDGIDPAMASFAARAAQGHIGRAKRLATDEDARLRRHDVLRLPLSLNDLGAALEAAAALVKAATEEAQETGAPVDLDETEQLRRALGAGTTGRGMVSGAGAQLKDLEKQQKARATRLKRDALDRALVDLASFYRDVLAVQVGAAVELVNEEMRETVIGIARSSPPEATLRRIDAVLAARDAIGASVAPLLAIEALTVALGAGSAG